jgi:hypothetical protein
LAGYALGWFVHEYRDRRLIHHSGGLSGQITYTGFFPESGHAFASSPTPRTALSQGCATPSWTI